MKAKNKMISKTLKMKRMFKRTTNKIFGIVMSLLMMFSCINVSGVKTVFAASPDLGYQANTDKDGTQTIIRDLWDHQEVSGYDVSIGNSRAFTLDMTGKMDNNIYMDRANLEANKDSIRKAANWYYANATNENFWIAQTLIWGIEGGKITNYTGDAILPQVEKVMRAAGLAYNVDYVTEALNQINNFNSTGTYYVYSYTDGYVRLLSNNAGTVPTANYSTVNSEQTYNRTEKILVRINKTDVDTKHGLSDVVFEFYKDNLKETEVTTNSKGVAEHIFTESISKTKQAQAEYVANYDQLSPKNKVIATQGGQHVSQAKAQEFADNQAKALAKAEAESANSGEHTYKVVEKTTKEGYYLNPNNTTFEKALTGHYSADTTNDGVVEFGVTNAQQTGTITIQKTDAQSSTGIENALYGLYAQEDIIALDGSSRVLYRKGNLVKEFPRTNKEGIAKLNNLPLGQYFVKEIEAPENYNLSDQRYTVSLDYAGQDKNVSEKTQGVTDEWQSGTITISKVDSETRQPIQGAVFELYAKENIMHPDKSGKIVHKANEKIGTFPATNAEGKASYEGLYLGEYYLKEIETVDNYYCDDTPVNVTLTYAGQEETVSVKQVTVPNHRQEGKLTVTQKDAETKQNVPGAVYEIYAKENIEYPDGITGIKYHKDELVATLEPTNSDGESVIEHLYLGEYYIKLKTAPDGYVYKENRLNVEFTYSGQDINVNPKALETKLSVQRGEISFIKEDKDLYEQQVDKNLVDTDNDRAQADATREGATYGLYARRDINHKDTHTGPVSYNQVNNDINEIELLKGTDLQVMNNKATAGTLLATAKTDVNGEISFGHLYLGDYFIKEIEPSEGYKLDVTEYDVSLVYAGQDEELTTAETTVFEKIMKQAFTINKVGKVPNVGNTTKPLRDVQFQVKLESDIQRLVESGKTLDEAKELAPLYDTLTTNKDGNATSVELPYGTYRVMETVTPKDYNPSEDFFVEIRTDSRTPLQYGTPVVNDYFFAHLQIRSIDKETGKQILLPNAEYRIKALTECYVDGKTFNPGEYISYVKFDVSRLGNLFNGEGFTVDSWTSNEDGFIELEEMISAGTYNLELVHAPEGYVHDESPVRFEITTEGIYQLNEAGEPVFTVSKELDPAKAELTVSKQGEVLLGHDSDNNEFTYELRGLQNAKYQIIAKENILDPSGDGTVLYAKGDVVATVTTNKNGTVTTPKLPLGEYTIKELTAPHGYSLNEEPQNVRALYVDENTPVIRTSNIFLNERQEYIVEVTKLDKETKESVEGAEFTIFANEDIYNADGQIIVNQNDAVAKGLTDASGKVLIDGKLPCDVDFYMLETKAPLGYVSTTQREEFNSDYTVQTEPQIKVEKTFENDPTIVEISKEDKLTHVLPQGTKLHVLDKNNNKVDSWTTEQGKTHIIKRLHVNEEYTLVEELAANGYLKAENVKFTVKDTAKVQSVIMSDEQAKGTITVEKHGDVLQGVTIDENGNKTFQYGQRGLEGSIFEVYARENIKHPDNESEDFYKSGDKVATLTTDENGIAKTDKLPLGKYSIKEIKAPEGFVLDSASRDVDLDYVDQLTSVVNKEMEFGNERQKVNVDTVKKDADTNLNVEGAEFTIFAKEDIVNADNEVIVKAGEKIRTIVTDENGVASFTRDLPLGKYIVKETRAPIGFSSTEKVNEVNATYQGQNIAEINVSCEFTNIPTKVELSKVDALTDVKTEGNIMELYDSHNRLVATWTTELNKSHIEKYLHVGETYTLVEKLAAEGYLKAENITFVVEDKKDTGDIQIIEPMRDEQVKGQITVIKKGEVLKGFENGQFVYETKNLSDAIFEIYAKEDIKHPDKVSEDYYKAGDLVATLTTGQDGKAISEKLPLGQYIVKEVKAPHGFVLDETEMDVTLQYVDQTTPVVFDSTEKLNARQTLTLDLNKLDVDSNLSVEGAEFTLYANKDIVNYDGEVIVRNGEEIAKAVSDKDGKVRFTVDLPIDLDSQVTAKDDLDSGFTVNTDADGNRIIGDVNSMFKIEETATPKGYASLNTIIYVDTTYRGQNVNDYVISYDVFNEMTRMEFSLVDSQNGEFVKGSELSIIPVKEDGSEDEAFATFTTDTMPHVVRGLEPGEYILRHTLKDALKDGYVTSEDIHFVVKDTTDMQSTVMYANHTNSAFNVMDTAKESIENSEMSIVKLDENGLPLYDQKLHSWTTDKEEKLVEYLPIGKYALIQNKAANGFVKSIPVMFEIKDTKELQKVEMINKVVEFSLVDVDENVLLDSEIEILDEAGNVVDSFVTLKTY